MLARTRNVVKAGLFEIAAPWKSAIAPDHWVIIGVIRNTTVVLTRRRPSARRSGWLDEEGT